MILLSISGVRLPPLCAGARPGRGRETREAKTDGPEPSFLLLTWPGREAEAGHSLEFCSRRRHLAAAPQCPADPAGDGSTA